MAKDPYDEGTPDMFGMTDDDLAKAMNCSVEDVGKLTPGMRATCERLIQVGDQANLYMAGLGPKPAGVILCGPRQIRGAGRE
ncbi:MAG TPA: hypothetical protein VJP88_08700 [Caulobacteraceae bacterium]|nr:hypothetical protein [Caulobacteraceae bacterium]